MLYFVTLSLELVLSITMLTLLWLILAPRGADSPPMTRPPQRASPRLAPTPEEALRSAFQSVSRGNDDVAVLVHARHLLVQLTREER